MENGQGPSLTELTFQDGFDKSGQNQQVKFNRDKHKGLHLDAGDSWARAKWALVGDNLVKELFSNVRAFAFIFKGSQVQL